MVTAAGETVILVRTAEVTVSRVAPCMVPRVAVIVAEPAAFVVTMPFVPAEATLPLDEDQFANEVTSLVLPSFRVAIAVYCCVTDSGTLAFAGVTSMDVIVCDQQAVAIKRQSPRTFTTERDNFFINYDSFVKNPLRPINTNRTRDSATRPPSPIAFG